MQFSPSRPARGRVRLNRPTVGISSVCRPRNQPNVASLRKSKRKVLRDWRDQRQREDSEKYYAALLKKYDVVVDESVKSLVGPLVGPIAGQVDPSGGEGATIDPAITVTREPEDGNPASSGQVVLTNRHP